MNYRIFLIGNSIGKKHREIIASTTFDCDESKENLIVYWRGINDTFSNSENAPAD